MQQRCFVGRRPELGPLLCKSVSLGRNDFPSGNQARLKAFGRKTPGADCDATKSSAADAEEAVRPKLPISRSPCRVILYANEKAFANSETRLSVGDGPSPDSGVAAH